MRNRFLDFLLTLLMRLLAGVVLGAIVGLMFNFHAFVRGSATNQFPWYLLKWWCLGGAVLLAFTIPKENRFWTKRRDR